MDRREAVLFCQEVDATFRGELTEPQEAALRRHLADVELAEARAALGLLVEDGQVFVPVASEVLGAVRRLRGEARALPWAEAWPVITEGLRRYARTDRSPEKRRLLVEAVGRRCGEGAARFVQSCGPDRLLMEPVDGEHGGAVLHRLRQDYEACCGQAREDGRVGRALEAARRLELGGRSGLRRLEAGS